MSFIMNIARDKLQTWGSEPANAQRLDNIEGGDQMFNWLTRENNSLYETICSSRGFNAEDITADMSFLLEAAERNGNSAEGIQEAYERNPSGFVLALQSHDAAKLDQMIAAQRDPQIATGPSNNQPAPAQPQDPVQDVEDTTAQTVEDDRATPEQKAAGAEVLEALFGVMSGDMDVDTFMDALVNFIELLTGTDLDGNAQRLEGSRQQIEAAIDIPDPIELDQAPEQAPDTPEVAANTSAPAGPGM